MPLFFWSRIHSPGTAPGAITLEPLTGLSQTRLSLLALAFIASGVNVMLHQWDRRELAVIVNQQQNRSSNSNTASKNVTKEFQGVARDRYDGQQKHRW